MELVTATPFFDPLDLEESLNIKLSESAESLRELVETREETSPPSTKQKGMLKPKLQRSV